MEKLNGILVMEYYSKDVELTPDTLGDCKPANKVVIAHEGVEAFDYLHRREVSAFRPDGNPAVIVPNLKSPGLDSIEVLRQLKSDDRMCSAPIDIFTSSREHLDLAVPQTWRKRLRTEAGSIRRAC